MVMRHELVPKLNKVRRYGDSNLFLTESVYHHIKKMQKRAGKTVENCGIVGLNMPKIIELTRVHDIDEIGLERDITSKAAARDPKVKQLKKENALKLMEELAQKHGAWLLESWLEAEECATPESKFVHILDRIESSEYILDNLRRTENKYVHVEEEDIVTPAYDTSRPGISGGLTSRNEYEALRACFEQNIPLPHQNIISQEEAYLNIDKLLKSLSVLDKNDTELWKIAPYIDNLIDKTMTEYKRLGYECKPEWQGEKPRKLAPQAKVEEWSHG